MATRRRRLVTERDVRRAAAEGTTALDTTNAVVTPSARDAARTLGISLRPSQVATETSTPGPVPPAVTAAIVLGADHGGLPLKDAILAHLRKAGMTVSDVGTHDSAAVDYPDFAVAVARTVADGRAAFGVMVDGAGIGSCMACNKVPGVRAAMCYDVTTAANAREHNNANVLTLGGTLIGPRLALEIVDTFLRTPFGGGRHQPRVDKVDALLPRPR